MTQEVTPEETLAWMNNAFRNSDATIGLDDFEDVRAALTRFRQAALTAAQSEADDLRAEVERLRAERDTPETNDFIDGVKREAVHQRARWGVDHDAGKTPFDWFWLIGYLAQKAADAEVRGDTEKAKHHTISTAAALSNWHLALAGVDNRMRPGIEPPARQALAGQP